MVCDGADGGGALGGFDGVEGGVGGLGWEGCGEGGHFGRGGGDGAVVEAVWMGVEEGVGPEVVGSSVYGGSMSCGGS